MRNDSNQLEKEMQNRHMSVNEFIENGIKPIRMPVLESCSPRQPEIQFEGYLFKRTSKGFKSWNRRWFCLSNNQLLYV